MARRVVRPRVAICRRYKRKALICPRESGSTWTRKWLARVSLGLASPLPKPIRTAPNRVDLSSISHVTTNHVAPDAFVRGPSAARQASCWRCKSLQTIGRALLDGADECVRPYVWSLRSCLPTSPPAPSSPRHSPPCHPPASRSLRSVPWRPSSLSPYLSSQEGASFRQWPLGLRLRFLLRPPP